MVVKSMTIKLKFLMYLFLAVFQDELLYAMSARAFLAELALKQAESPDAGWSLEQRDCAGLIRYVFSKTFKSSKGLWNDRTGKKSFYLRAEELISQNFLPVPMSTYDALSYGKLETGDIIVYHNPSKSPSDAWHLMLILFPKDRHENQPLLVYHNGANDQTAAVRKIWWETLFQPAWLEWRPDVRNPFFKGFYRWRGFLSSGERGALDANKF